MEVCDTVFTPHRAMAIVVWRNLPEYPSNKNIQYEALRTTLDIDTSASSPSTPMFLKGMCTMTVDRNALALKQKDINSNQLEGMGRSFLSGLKLYVTVCMWRGVESDLESWMKLWNEVRLDWQSQ